MDARRFRHPAIDPLPLDEEYFDDPRASHAKKGSRWMFAMLFALCLSVLIVIVATVLLWS